MERYNNELRVGGLAIIINTRRPENKHLIGQTVTVEEVMDIGVRPNLRWFNIDELSNRKINWDTGVKRAVVSGIFSSAGDVFIDGHAQFIADHLMPIGDDDQLNELFGEETNPYKEAACS